MPAWSADALGIVGLGLIVVALATLRASQPFPGWRALLPTLGAAALLAAGQRAWVGRVLLSNRVAVFFGAISYPLYLWHWPLLVFPNIFNGSVPRNVRIAAVLASIALAWLTYRFVESPIRSGSAKRVTTALLCWAMVGIGLLGLALYVSHGWPQRYPPELRDVAIADQVFDYSAYRERECFLMAEQAARLAPSCIEPKAPGKEKLVLLWGDSHAASLSPGLRALLGAAGSPYRLAQFNASGCPPVVGFKVTSRPHCQAMNDEVLRLVQAHKPDVVVLLASWSFYNGQGEFDKLDLSEVAHTVDRLHAAGVPEIVVLGPLPRWVEHEPDVVLREWKRLGAVPERSMAKVDQNVFATDTRLRAALAGSPAQYVSLLQLLCAQDGCRLRVRRGGREFPMAWDDAHLSVEGSTEVAQLLAPILLAGGR